MKTFPWVLVLLNLGAAIVYLLNHNWRLAVYFSLSAGIIASISL